MLEPFILFQVAQATYAVRSAEVQQIEMVEKVTHVPNAPAFVDGVVYLRGEVVPVINLRARFGFERLPYDLRSRLVVIRVERRLLGLAVDSAREFVRLDASQLPPPPEDLQGASLEYLEGVLAWNDRLLLVVNLKALLTYVEKQTLEAMT